MKPTLWQRWQGRARALKKEVLALYFALRDPRTPWYGKALAALVVAYAFSPIDLIPDFVPVLGYLDDLVLLPIGAALALRAIPPEVMADARAQAEQRLSSGKPVSWAGAVVIGAVWVAIMAVGVWWVWRVFQARP
ncbi:MAG: DUF1232 domain-containing protein [Anaerolineales bacterium]